MLGKKDQKVTQWLLDSMTETLLDSVNPTESYQVTLGIIEFISYLISVDSDPESIEFLLVDTLLGLFTQILMSLDVEKFNKEFFMNFLSTLSIVIDNFSKNKEMYASLSTIYQIVDFLTMLVVNCYDKLITTSENKYEIILKISTIFKIYGSW